MNDQFDTLTGRYINIEGGESVRPDDGQTVVRVSEVEEHLVGDNKVVIKTFKGERVDE